MWNVRYILLLLFVLLTVRATAGNERTSEENANGGKILYEEGIRSFSATNVDLQIGLKLVPLLQRKEGANYFIVTPRTWVSDKSILSVSVEDGVCCAELISVNGKRKHLDSSGLELYLGDIAYFSYNNKCYLFLNGSNNHIALSAHFVKGVPLMKYIYGSMDKAVRDLKLKIPSYQYAVSFRFCNGKEVVRLGIYTADALIDERLIREKIKPVIQKRSDMAWRIRHKNKLNRKPRVVFGPVERVEKDSKGNFVIPITPPPTMATSVWEEVVYEYHNDGYEEWSVPVGTIEHEKVKRLTQKYNYEFLRAEAERFQEEMEAERNAIPPEVSESDIDYEVEKGVLLFDKGVKTKGGQTSVIASTSNKARTANAKRITNFYGVKIGHPIYTQSPEHCTVADVSDAWCHAKFDGSLLGFREGTIHWTGVSKLVHSVCLHRDYDESTQMDKVRTFIVNELEKLFDGHFVSRNTTEANRVDNCKYVGYMYFGQMKGEYQHICMVIGDSKETGNPVVYVMFRDSAMLNVCVEELKQANQLKR